MRILVFAAVAVTFVACEPRYQEAQQPPPGQLPPGQPPPPGYYAPPPGAAQPGAQPAGAPAATTTAAAPTAPTATAPAPSGSVTASSTSTPPVLANTAPQSSASVPPPAPEPAAELPPAGVGKRGEGQACSVHKDCESGMCEGEGCGFNAGKCVRKDRMCTRDLVMYCGCNGKPFSSSGSCPGRVYKNKGPCK